MWFRATPEFDRELEQRFKPLWKVAAEDGLSHWESGADGALALVIVLDQFPLNMHRGKREGFLTEAAARSVSNKAIAQGLDQQLGNEQKSFLYIPFMHGETLKDQDRSVALYEAAGLESGLRFARHHREIIRRFGRFPHRNAILGRVSTEAEVEYLNSKQAFKG